MHRQLKGGRNYNTHFSRLHYTTAHTQDIGKLRAHHMSVFFMSFISRIHKFIYIYFFFYCVILLTHSCKNMTMFILWHMCTVSDTFQSRYLWYFMLRHNHSTSRTLAPLLQLLQLRFYHKPILYPYRCELIFFSDLWNNSHHIQTHLHISGSKYCKITVPS